jgi:FAD:protein FMN transferase
MFTYAFPAMTTRCELTLFGVSPAAGRDLGRQVEAHVAMQVALFNFHAPSSWLSREVNARRSDRVPLPPDLRNVLALVRSHAIRTHGAFDITVGTWADALKMARSPQEVAEVRRRMAPFVGVSHWWIDGDTLCFDNPLTRLDLGGVIKEHAVDAAAGMAREAGVSAGLVNFGGDVFAFGRKPDGSRFVAAVPNPLSPNQMLFGLDLEDQALTTSGHYARRRVLPGPERAELSHVLSTTEGGRWLSASVVSGSALISGIYSTALLVCNEVDLPAGATAVTVDREGRIHTSSGPKTAPAESINSNLTRMAPCA